MLLLLCISVFTLEQDVVHWWWSWLVMVKKEDAGGFYFLFFIFIFIFFCFILKRKKKKRKKKKTCRPCRALEIRTASLIQRHTRPRTISTEERSLASLESHSANAFLRLNLRFERRVGHTGLGTYEGALSRARSWCEVLKRLSSGTSGMQANQWDYTIVTDLWLKNFFFSSRKFNVFCYVWFKVLDRSTIKKKDI